MKQFIAIIFLSAITIIGYSQENMVTLSGGYSFGSVEYTDGNVIDVNLEFTGWRINGLYEFNANEGKLAHGLSIGFISLSTSESENQTDSADYKASTLPIYYAPKLLFGSDKIKGFVKGAIGFQHTKLKRTSYFNTESEIDGWGFYGGLGAGVMFLINEKFFINAEYEFAWMTNSYYSGGIVNSVMGGIGVKF